ncbi:ribonuclease Y [Mycoplasma capricolum]|uniref:ribonuclease Y n=1 Tax=Mycoplasma capricolum TaxID=2095 RepID=UPI003DA2001C
MNDDIIILLSVFCGIFFICFIICSSIALYLWKSKSRKRLVEQYTKEAKQAKKQILANGYKEISEAKMLFLKRSELEKNELDRVKEQLELRSNDLKRNQEIVESKSQRLDASLLDLEKRKFLLDKKEEYLIKVLEDASGLTKSQAKELLIKQVKNKSEKELISILKNAELQAHSNSKMIANNIIISAMERIKVELTSQRTTNIVKLPSDDLKGRIIGKDGRNMKAFEQIGGVDIVIDETPNTVVVSSFNPIRREIATRTLEQLIIDGRIQPVKIENELKKQEQELEYIIQETGLSTIKELNINDIDIELVKLIGKLKFRTSYGQNVLAHSIEVAKLSGAIASELGLDVEKAIRAGLLHDIGKAIDFEKQGSHVVLGAEIAKKYNEDPIVINCIESHHEDKEKESEIAAIVAIADSISASRPGARYNAIDEFILRMTEIEKIGNSIPGVAKTYALQSGRQIRLIVDPLVVSDLDLAMILEKMKEEIKNKVIIPGEITITVIRERKETDVLK